MDLILIMIGLFAVPWLLFVIPMVYADNKSKGMLEDLNSYPMDYTE